MFPLSLMDSVLTLEGCLDVRTAGGEILALLSNTIDDNRLPTTCLDELHTTPT